MSLPPHSRVWIVGARGLLGTALRGLLPREDVVAFDPAFGAGEGGIAACVQTPGVVENALVGGAPEVVFFCAATHGGDVEAYCRAYREPVQTVAAVAPGARLVFCSSTSVYEGQGDVTEDSPTPGSTAKWRVLLEAEQATLAAGGVVARLAPLYGPGRCELLRRHLAGEPRLPGTPERMLNYLHVADAAEALLLLATVPRFPHRVYNLCGESLSHAQAYALLEEYTGVPASREVAPARRRGMSNHRVLADRMRSLFTPRHGLADFVQREMRGEK